MQIDPESGTALTGNDHAVPIDLKEFFIQFQDYLAPKLDTYEQAIYLYIFRKSRLLGLDEVTIGFKTARARLATGIGERGKPMSEASCYSRLRSLEQIGCIKVVRTNHAGRLLRLYLPSEIQGVIPIPPQERVVDIETMDFFDVPENRLLLLKRENHRCFYTFQKLDKDNFIVEHIVSRPAGNNSYRNCVAASREANNKKGATSADDFLRRLYRENILNESEFQDRIRALAQLKDGLLKPPLE
ncbi:MAG: HNH endonuclease [Candidatus Korobacteraceae bacterium]